MSYTDVVLADLPTHYWPLGEVSGPFQDLGSSSIPATVAGSVVRGGAGQQGRAITPDGSTGYLSIASIALSSTALTVEAIVRTTDTSAVQTTIDLPRNPIVGAVTTGPLANAFGITGGKVHLIIFNSAGTVSQDGLGATNIADGQWHHIAGTYDGTTIKVYVNGVLDGTLVTSSHYGPGSGNDALLGQFGPSLYHGDVQHIAVYGSVLSVSHLASHAKEFSQSPLVERFGYLDEVMKDSPIAVWGFLSATSNIHDLTGHGYDGTSAGSVYAGAQVSILPNREGLSGAFTAARGDVSSVPALCPPGALAVDAWVLFTSVGTQQGIVEHYGISSVDGTNGFLFRTDGTGKLIAEFTSAGGAAVTSVSSIVANVLYHVAYVWDGAAHRIYINGKLDAVTVSATGPSTPTQPLRIGGRGNDGGFMITGSLQYPALYAGLSPDRVAAHYRAGISNIPDAGSYINEILKDSPSHYWSLTDAPDFGASGDAKDLVVPSDRTIYGSGVGVDIGVGGRECMVMSATNGSTLTSYTQSGIYVETWECWFRTTSATITWYSVRGFYGGTSGRSLTKGLDAGCPFCVWDTDNVRIGRRTVNTYNDGKWHHFVSIWARAGGSGNVVPSDWTLYVDGVVQATVDYTTNFGGNITTPAQGLDSAFFTTSVTTYEMHDVAIYPTALSAARILAHYKAMFSDGVSY